MALGGYKFVGYKCVKGNLSDTAFCLLMHKTRLKAFVESCAASGAQWVFCKNGGTIDFEGNTGVIYQVDSDGYNYVSFFRYGNEDKYIAIVSLPNQTVAFNDAAILYAISTYTYSANTYYFTMFHCASLDPFDDPLFFLSGHTYPQRALQLMPITNLYEHATGLATLSTSYSFYESANARGTTCYFGYATKDSKIVTFASTSDLSYLSNGYINATLIGFDSMQLSSPNDTANLFCTVLRYYRSNEIGWTEASQIEINMLTAVLTGIGQRYNARSRANHILFSGSHKAIIASGANTVPYESIVVASGDSAYNGIRTAAPFLNSDGILSKGTVDIDFVACNVRIGNGLTNAAPYANGNYLLISNGNSSGYNPQFYVGWDPSNPEIKLDASWTAYTE